MSVILAQIRGTSPVCTNQLRLNSCIGVGVFSVSTFVKVSMLECTFDSELATTDMRVDLCQFAMNTAQLLLVTKYARLGPSWRC